jgi:hypothetical protein
MRALSHINFRSTATPLDLHQIARRYAHLTGKPRVATLNVLSKVAMVNKIELSYLSGVIVVSTDKSSQQSLVSKLSGGDLDGGEFYII